MITARKWYSGWTNDMKKDLQGLASVSADTQSGLNSDGDPLPGKIEQVEIVFPPNTLYNRKTYLLPDPIVIWRTTLTLQFKTEQETAKIRQKCASKSGNTSKRPKKKHQLWEREVKTAKKDMN